MSPGRVMLVATCYSCTARDALGWHSGERRAHPARASWEESSFFKRINCRSNTVTCRTVHAEYYAPMERSQGAPPYRASSKMISDLVHHKVGVPLDGAALFRVSVAWAAWHVPQGRPRRAPGAQELLECRAQRFSFILGTLPP